MKDEIAKIISASISNIGNARDDEYIRNLYAMKAMANQLALGIKKLEELWPNLSDEEKQELESVIEFLKVSYDFADEETIKEMYLK